MKNSDIILDVKNLSKTYSVEKGFFKKKVGSLRAVDNINLELYKGETFGLVGESGCGKSTLGMSILDGNIDSGSIKYNFDGKKLEFSKASSKDIKEFRKYAQLIFQDPYSSLNSRMTIRDIIGEPLLINSDLSKEAITDKVITTLNLVGLDSGYLYRYPHAFSGGQRQRISIARALILEPKFIVADEPTSALDVSIQAQILNLLVKLQDKLNLTYLFISHDLSVIRHLADRIGIMYLGKIVEYGDNQTIFNHPKHPYTKALLQAIPLPNPKIVSGLKSAPGEIPNAMNPPTGCSFHPRCSEAKKLCLSKITSIKEINDKHYVSCHLYN